MLRSGGTFIEFGLESVVGIIDRRAKEEVSDFCGEFWTEGADDVLESRLLRGYAASCELGLELGEPDFGIGGPEGWQLDADCGDGRERRRWLWPDDRIQKR